MEELKHLVVEEICRRGLRKKGDGLIYEPRGPCSYRATEETFKKFLNRVLRGHPVYTGDPRRHDKLMTFLRRSEEDGLPTLEEDRGLLAFDNGVLLLRTGEFVEDPGEDARTQGRIAWHHIDGELHLEEEPRTPWMDKLVLRQMSAEKYEELLRVFGRLLVEGGWDGWDRIPCLRGVTATGKSCIQHVMMGMGLPPMPVVFRGYRAPRKVLVLRWVSRATSKHQVFDCGTRVPSSEIDTRLESKILGTELPALVVKSLRAWRRALEGF